MNRVSVERICFHLQPITHPGACGKTGGMPQNHWLETELVSRGVLALLHHARPVLLNLGAPDGFDIAPWADRVQLVDAQYIGEWELPALGVVSARTAVLIRPDGYVAWVGDRADERLTDALTIWFGPPNDEAHLRHLVTVRTPRLPGH